jgi:hypothetical protein
MRAKRKKPYRTLKRKVFTKTRLPDNRVVFGFRKKNHVKLMIDTTKYMDTTIETSIYVMYPLLGDIPI